MIAVHSTPISPASPYAILMVAAIAVSAIYWMRVSKSDSRLPILFVIALAGAFLGAKAAYMMAEGWMITGPDRWLHWLTGKSITGALIGGFIAVETGKRLLGYTKITGDRFALIAPVSIVMGRIGCLSHGCCQGIACNLPAGLTHWPAVATEITFNLIMITAFVIMRKKNLQTYQHFHIYLIAYGIFRFLHEFLRATPKPFLSLSGYQIIAITMTIIGYIAWRKRNQLNTQN